MTGATSDAAPMVRITLLGEFAVAIGARQITADSWKLARARSVVKLLALAPGYRLGRDQLLEYLWPDFPPETAITNLYSTLNAARQALAPVVPLRLRGGAVALDPPGPLFVDVTAFAAAAEQARRSGTTADIAAALAHYGGELLPEDRYEDWATARREELREIYHRLLLGLAECQQADGEPTTALTTLERLVADDPAHEEGQVALMRLQAQLGQRARAIRQYQALRTALERDLDTEPGPVARRLYGDIVTGELPVKAVPPRETGQKSSAAARPAPVGDYPPLPIALSKDARENPRPLGMG